MDAATLLMVGPSTLGVPTLDTIPGSANGSPNRTPPQEESPPIEHTSEPFQPEAGPSSRPFTPSNYPEHHSSSGGDLNTISSSSKRSSFISSSNSSSLPPIPGSSSFLPSSTTGNNQDVSSSSVIGYLGLGDSLKLDGVDFGESNDDPTFSEYHSTVPSRRSSLGKARAFVFPLKSAFSLSLRRRSKSRSFDQDVEDTDDNADDEDDDDGEDDHNDEEHTRHLDSSGSNTPIEVKGRRKRAVTISHHPPILAASSKLHPPVNLHDQSRRKSSASHHYHYIRPAALESPSDSKLVHVDEAASPTSQAPSSPTSPKPLSFFGRRRASVGSIPYGKELRKARIVSESEKETWPNMAVEEAKRMEFSTPPSPSLFAYQQPTGNMPVLEAVSAQTIGRPLTPVKPQSPNMISDLPIQPPNVTPRRSSLSGAPPAFLSSLIEGIAAGSPRRSTSNTASQPGTPAGLGLANIPISPVSAQLLSSDGEAPHDPPPRRSSLSFGPNTVIDDGKNSRPNSGYDFSPSSTSGTSHHDMTSLLSGSHGSHNTTEESLGQEIFSPALSALHPLSSATTSLSRSAKSGKERQTDSEAANDSAKEAAMNALRLQRSLEWEARQSRHRKRIEKRRMILLELVETEVGYAEDLKTLVQVYLPQLHALPSLTEKTGQAIGRNAADLLSLHSGLAIKMVEVLKQEGLGYEREDDSYENGRKGGSDLAAIVERVARRLASILVEDAASLIRHIALRTDYDAFERRCQIICSSHPPATLTDLLSQKGSEDAAKKSHPSRLHFKDYLIKPIQRVCKYPLLLSALLNAASTPSPTSERRPSFDHLYQGESDEYDVGVDVERALGAMRGVAEEADESRKKKEAEIRSNIIINRLEPHPAVTPAFIRGLGSAKLIGSLDVLHHHPVMAPLVPPVKVKYMAAFLYKGYLILAKVKKGRMYEVKHYLPLEVFELIDITEGFLPHSIRLSLRDHNFELAASCDAEKDVWAAALVSAREESNVPPFELPASVSPFAARSRRMSNLPPLQISTDLSPSPTTSSNKRNTLPGLPSSTPFDAPSTAILDHSTSSPDKPLPLAPSTSSQTILLRRASGSQRLNVDRGISDIFSDTCAQARSKAQLQSGLFMAKSHGRRDKNKSIDGAELRDRLNMKDSTMIKRRRSFLDAATRQRHNSLDTLTFTGEVRGSVLAARGSKRQRASMPPMSQTGDVVGSNNFGHGGLNHSGSINTHLTGNLAGDESQTDMDNADDTATSDYGTMRDYRSRTATATARGSRAASVINSPLFPTRARTTVGFRPSLDNIVTGIPHHNQNADIVERRPLDSPTSALIFSPQKSNPRLSEPSPEPKSSGMGLPKRFASFRSSPKKSKSVLNLKEGSEGGGHDRSRSTPTTPLMKAVNKVTQPVKRATSDPEHRGKTDEIPPMTLDDPFELTVPGINGPKLPPKDRPIFEPLAPPDNGSTDTVEGGDTEDAVYMLGSGLTNRPAEQSSPSTAWGSLRRAKSRLSNSRTTSAFNLNELTSHNASTSTISPIHSGENLMDRNNSFGVISLSSGGSSLNFGDEFGMPNKLEDNTEEGGSRLLTPKRSRSVRLLQSLRGFTPI